MYIPRHFEETDLAVLHALIRQRPLGAWVVFANGELTANHLPFLIDADRGPNGTLIGHVARSNEVWKSLTARTPSMVIFQGPQRYITPSWYRSKQETGRVVPTWNYAVVHAYGSPRVIHDEAWLRAHVTELSHTHEHDRTVPWQVTDAPAPFIDTLLKAIVGIEIPLDSLQGKWKVSQNRSHADLIGTARGLSEEDDPEAQQLATLIAQAAARKQPDGDNG
jgi:transcriptional regulator